MIAAESYWAEQFAQFTQLEELATERLASFMERAESSLQISQLRLKVAFALSDFIYDQLWTHPQWYMALAQLPEDMDAWIVRDTWQASHTNEKALSNYVRQLRQQFMLRIAWLELSQQITIEQSMYWLSEFASQMLNYVLEALVEKNRPIYGLPYDPEGHLQSMQILAMGKLGGYELNFSSDIDLIFCYPEQGETQGGRRSQPNQEYFIRLGQQLIQLLSRVDAYGFVFRVDMRLRPFGQSGPLAVSHSALEDYYQHHGRDWERYAMIKARCVTNKQNAPHLYTRLKPFVYRRYIDFSVVESLRQMKGMILAEVRRRGLENNIKLGRGGIREIEFIVQAEQLIWGGRCAAVQQNSLLMALEELANLGHLPDEMPQSLRRCYLFLRQVENYLQEFNDQQTQTLPVDILNQQRLAWLLHLPDWSDVQKQIMDVLEQVTHCFDELFGSSLSQEPVHDERYRSLWLALGEPHDEYPLDDSLPNAIVEQLQTFHQQAQHRLLGDKGRRTLDLLMPHVLPMLMEYPECERLTGRVLSVFEAILARSTYLQLLLENPGALAQLLRLCDASEMVAKRLRDYPLLLDELLDPQSLQQVGTIEDYQEQLELFMLRIAPEDQELQLDALRQFKQIQMLRIAAADIAGILPLMQVSDHLTALAEVLCSYVVTLAWQQMTARYGLPADCQGDERGFVVLGYGKLGGFELGYGSDLDLVFIHSQQRDAPTQGPKVIDSKQFYLRFAQRIMHLFQTRTRAGILYEVDMRLRPSGNAGLLVSSWEAFADYQRHQAWTWEHQALVRARAINGDAGLRVQFHQLRQDVLSRPRELSLINEQVHQMREKMRRHLDRSTSMYMDLKYGEGAMVDIEFMAQRWVLLASATYPELTQWSDNIRIFEVAISHGLLSAHDGELLIDSYIQLRSLAHHRVLQAQSSLIEREQLSDKVQQMFVEIARLYRQQFQLTTSDMP